VAAVEFNDAGHPQNVRFDQLADLKGETLANWARKALHTSVHLVTDGPASFSAAAAVMAEEMLTPGKGQMRAMITVAGNPVLSTPNGEQLDRAYASLDFAVSVDFYINETSRHADVILPPVSPIQRSHYDIALYLTAVRNVAKYSASPFSSKKDELEDWEILAELTCQLIAGRTGKLSIEYLTARAVQKAGPHRLLDLGLRLGPYGKGINPLGNGLTLRKLKENPHGVDLGPLQSSLLGRLPKEHGAIDLTPALFVADLDRLRDRFFPTASTSADGRLPLIGRRHLRSKNSWLHNAPRLMKGKPRCRLLIHPDDAGRLGVKSGELVTVRSRVGQVCVPAEITGDIMAGVVSLPHGYGYDRDSVRLGVATNHFGASANDLTDERFIDALSGNAAFNGVAVTVAPAEQDIPEEQVSAP
jgi:anaerobic selenocysteine-containing dehydrogenase